MGPNTAWIASLSPWPEEFGLERMHALLDALGHPERAYPAIHVVGTNGKSTAVRTIGALLETEGLRVGCYTSPHVSGWGERLDTDDQGFERSVGRVREAAERVGATQFEALTAAALAEFAAREVDVAVVEAGLGGRLDATNVLDARVVLLTNVSLEHTEVLGDTREAIAREKLAVAGPDAIVVLGESEWTSLVAGQRCADRRRPRGGGGVPRPVDLGRRSRSRSRAGSSVAGRTRSGTARTRPEGIDWLLERIPDARLGRRLLDARRQGRRCDARAPRDGREDARRHAVVQRRARFPRRELAGRARRYVSDVLAIEDPVAAVREARALGDAVLVTGSLYLLADLHGARWE